MLKKNGELTLYYMLPSFFLYINMQINMHVKQCKAVNLFNYGINNVNSNQDEYDDNNKHYNENNKDNDNDNNNFFTNKKKRDF